MATRIKPWVALAVLVHLFFFPTQPIAAGDSIAFGQSLSGNQTISSENGIFETGFFTPGNSRKYYIGIWYKKIPGMVVVWVANREKPLPDATSHELTIAENGELVLLNKSKSPIWSSHNGSKTSNSTVAVLQDDGNLVLRHRSISSDVYWQSFDHLTDTCLPGAKMGYNRTTGQNSALTSWRNSEDPAPGMFSLEVDPSGLTQFFMVWNMTRVYWSSGVWDGHIFGNVPEMSSLHEYYFTGHSSVNASYITYGDIVKSAIPNMVVDLTGQMRWRLWSEDTQKWVLFNSFPRDPCDVYLPCGPFGICNHYNSPACACLPGFEPKFMADWNLSDSTGGCVRKTSLQCGNKSSVNGEKDGFLMMPDMQLPSNFSTVVAQSAEECELACLASCSCNAYSYNSGCSIWKGDLLNMKQVSNGSQSVILYLRLAASDIPSSGGKEGSNEGIIIGALAGFIFLIFIISVLIWGHRRRRLRRYLFEGQNFLVPFRYKDLQTATQNFSKQLGKGSFGPVFKGTLPDTSVIAVKKLEGLRQGHKEFCTEVSTIGMIQHVNIVRLRGFCCEGTKRMLVYDYMPNGSLDSHLFPKSFEFLDWKVRLQITLNVAKGLAYLHEECRECIIHCDIKPENILLDETFCPKIADFGMAKLLGRDFSRVLTTMRGTIGYLAPEWISGVPITPKADVYSYGMMLFEIIAGRRNIEGSESADGKFSFFPVSAAQNLWGGEDINYLACGLDDQTNLEEIRRACRIACWCIQDLESQRPSMGEVVKMLEGVLEIQLPPIPRSLQNILSSEDELIFKLSICWSKARQI